MRRLLVPPVLLLTFLALGAWSGSAGAIVCPQASATTPCCGPTAYSPALVPGGCCPQSCCGTGAAEPACPVVQITISSNPDPSVTGHRVTISGQRAGASSGTAVDLWQKLPGQTSFQRVARTNTDSSGHYTFVRGAGAVTMNMSWYATASGATSRTVLQQVRAVLKLSAPSTRPLSGKAVTFVGSVSPAHAGERIVLQQRTTQGWRKIAAARIGAHSRFSLRHRFAHKGTVVLRALLSADRRNTQSTSAPVRIVVH